jgi:hypothetical protein
MSKDETRSIVQAISGQSALFVKRVETIAVETSQTLARGATASAEKAVSAKKWLDKKWEDRIDGLYNKHRPIAADNVERLRKELGDVSPQSLREHLGNEFRDFVLNEENNADLNLAATKLFVLSAVAVHGTQVKSAKSKRQLLAQALIATSSPVRFVVRNRPVLAAAISALITALAKAPAGTASKVVTKSTGTVTKVAKVVTAKVAPAIASSAIKREGAKSFILDVIIGHVCRTLGPAPASWPAATKKPVAKKSAAKKPAARRPKPSA